ncbi:hypothetical protein [Streptomyces sp. NBC_01180]|uniref:hypothetical protein n=1 Tax=Streptomyces sp. NBC_01180 TaxID=2903763 RepID=UPI0038692629|nr:hypothetical protein OG708_09060 [Streptomyces sp. NBC_01180]
MTGPIPGNLLEYNTQSFETDTSGWNIVNGTLVRSATPLVAGGGSYSGKGTATATGEMQLVVVNQYAVTAGAEYLAYVWGFSTTALPGSKIGIRWYDSTGAQILPNPEGFWDIPAGGIVATRLNVVSTAPVGAVKARMYVKATLAAGQSLYIDECFLGVAPNDPLNLLSYNEFSTEVSLPAWTATNGTVSMAYLYTANPEFQDGAYALKVTPASTGLVSVSLDRLVPVVPGETYWVGSTSLIAAAADGSAYQTSRTCVDWYRSDGTLLLADVPDQFYTSGGETVGHDATANSETRTAPPGAASGRIRVEIMHQDTSATMYYVDNIVFKGSGPQYAVTPHQDTASITVQVNWTPPATEVAYTLLRVHQDGSMHPVRGYVGDLVRTPYDGEIFVEDYEAPLGEDIWYRIDWFDSAGVSRIHLYTRSFQSPQLDDPSYVWFKSPGLPALNTTALMETPLEWSRAARSTEFDIVDRTNPVPISGVRGGNKGSLSILVWDAGTNTQFNELLSPGQPVLIQANPGYGINGNLYVSVGDSSAEQVSGSANEPGWRWTLAVTEIDRPTGGVQGSALATWQSILDNFDTWADVYDAFDTWADVLTYEP